MDPLVSVIIPVYNVFPYLKIAITSVIQQSYTKLEIIIIDDGSTDGSGFYCDEYKSDTRVKVIHQENQGLSGARNTGLDCATGEYITFLDSDDYYHPKAIEILLKALVSNKTDLAISDYVICYTENSEIGTEHKYDDHEMRILSNREAYIEMLEGTISRTVWNKLYTRKLWDGLRFPETHVYEDVWIMPDILKKCRSIVIISKNLVYHRIREGSITQTISENNICDYLLSHKKLLSIAKELSIPSNHIRNHEEEVLRNMISMWNQVRRTGNPDENTALLKMLENRIGSWINIFEKPPHTKTGMILWLYQHFPSLLTPSQTVYRMMKHISQRT